MPTAFVVTPATAPDPLNVVGEKITVLASGAQTGSYEIFRQAGPEGSGPPPHSHPWEEVYVVLDGKLEVIIDGESHVISSGGVAHVPAGVTHSYRNLTETHFLTITTEGQAAQFFTQVSSEVEMSPPDIPGILRVASSHEIEFSL